MILWYQISTTHKLTRDLDIKCKFPPSVTEEQWHAYVRTVLYLRGVEFVDINYNVNNVSWEKIARLWIIHMS